MECEGYDERRKHDKSCGAEDEEEAWKIHADEKCGARYENCEQRKGPLGMDRAGNITELDCVLLELQQEPRKRMRRKNRQSDGAGREEND